jgi:hypothetical protein
MDLSLQVRRMGLAAGRRLHQEEISEGYPDSSLHGQGVSFG